MVAPVLGRIVTGCAMCRTRVEAFLQQEAGRRPRSRPLPFPPGRPPGAPSPASVHMTSNVSMTSIAEPPARTGQPFASATAASRLSALMIV